MGENSTFLSIIWSLPIARAPLSERSVTGNFRGERDHHGISMRTSMGWFIWAPHLRHGRAPGKVVPEPEWSE
jgi:hypothetical protein